MNLDHQRINQICECKDECATCNLCSAQYSMYTCAGVLPSSQNGMPRQHPEALQHAGPTKGSTQQAPQATIDRGAPTLSSIGPRLYLGVRVGAAVALCVGGGPRLTMAQDDQHMLTADELTEDEMTPVAQRTAVQSVQGARQGLLAPGAAPRCVRRAFVTAPSAVTPC